MSSPPPASSQVWSQHTETPAPIVFLLSILPFLKSIFSTKFSGLKGMTDGLST